MKSQEVVSTLNIFMATVLLSDETRKGGKLWGQGWSGTLLGGRSFPVNMYKTRGAYGVFPERRRFCERSPALLAETLR